MVTLRKKQRKCSTPCWLSSVACYKQMLNGFDDSQSLSLAKLDFRYENVQLKSQNKVNLKLSQNKD